MVHLYLFYLFLLSLPMRGEWIEISIILDSSFHNMSLPMRGEWIEIWNMHFMQDNTTVSPHAGRVD